MSIEGQGHFFTICFLGFVCFVLYQAKISGERLQDSGFIYSTKKKRISKISQLSSPFNAKMLLVIKYLFLTNLTKLKCGVDDYLCLPCTRKRNIN